MVKRVLAGYGVDLDAVSGWINTPDGSAANPSDVSRGVFGATVGTDRVLALFDRYGIKGSWFVPAHTLESFPDQVAKVRDQGHEIGLHGYSHEIVSKLSEEQERDVLTESTRILTEFVGKKPRGWTAPAWFTTKHTIRLLEEAGIEYDHSFMHHDSQIYYVNDGSEHWVEPDLSKPASSWMTPMTALRQSSVVEIPASWTLDDWPPFQFAVRQPNAHGYVDTKVIENLWKEQFDFLYREYDTFIFPITIHPQVSGKPHVIRMHERFIEWVDTHEGVEWVTFETMVKEFKEGRISGTTVQGGKSQ